MTRSSRPAQPEQTLPDIPYLKFGEAATLTNCDREPIHTPGHAQAHGAVVALDAAEGDLTILQVSANLAHFCGTAPEEILGKGAAALFGPEQITLLRDAVTEGRLEASPVYLLTGLVGGRGPFHITAHTYRGVLTVELEPASDSWGAGEAPPYPDAQALLQRALPRLLAATTLRAYCRAVCETVQQISGFDRVMVYRFHEDSHGEVIGEVISEADHREPYLGLHYPESDIPKQARALYLLNAIRLMPDALYEPSPLVPPLCPRSGLPLDMSHCTLRGYSRMYTEYLTNMGSRASMSLAIVRDGALWGLIACHHQTPRWVPYVVRAACKFLTDIVSLQITGKMEGEESEYQGRILDVHWGLVESMVRHGAMLSGLTDGAAGRGTTALSLLDVQGCAVLSEQQCRLLGETPPEEEVRALICWLNDTRPAEEEAWATDALPAAYPPAEGFKDRAAGLLALRVSALPPTGEWVLWFRPEVSQTVKWGGNPHKPYETGPLGDRLTPRKSFEVWQETVRSRSLPWKAVEVEGACRLRLAIIQVIARRAEELARLNAELSVSNRELQDFAYIAAHDLQEPLRTIQSFGERLERKVGEDLPEEARDALERMLRAVVRMRSLVQDLLEFSRVTTNGESFQPVSLGQVAQQAWADLSSRAEETGGRMEIGPLPTVEADPMQMRQLLQNLIANALKYGRADVPPLITVRGGLTDAAGPGRARAMCRIEVQDNGIGFEERYAERIFAPFQRLHGRDKYEGTGIGLAICRKIVERHGGRITARSTPGVGSLFTVFVPVEQRTGEWPWPPKESVDRIG